MVFKRCLSCAEPNKQLYFYHADVFHILPSEMLAQSTNDTSFKARMLMRFRALRGYYICYMMEKQRQVGFCFLKHNYLCSYPFMKRNDLIISLYYVSEEDRGKKLGG